MVLSSDGKRLSKRDGAVDINDYKTKGYLKEALVNYLIKLGWTYKEQEIFSLIELIDFFSISDVNSSAAKFSQELLDFYNNHYLNSCSIDFLLDLLNKDFNLSAKFNDLPRKKEIIELMREGADTLCELKENIDFFYQDPNLTPQLFGGIKPEKEIFIKFNKELENLDFTEKNKIDTFLKSFLKLNNLKFPQLGKPLRLILTGKSDAPSISDLLYLIGRDACLERIQKFIDIY
jgi:glutamyl-tRNA synthetase